MSNANNYLPQDKSYWSFFNERNHLLKKQFKQLSTLGEILLIYWSYQILSSHLSNEKINKLRLEGPGKIAKCTKTPLPIFHDVFVAICPNKNTFNNNQNAWK